MNTPTTHYADPRLMAQRGRLFKLEPQPVVRELPAAVGVRDLRPGDILRMRTAPEILATVLEHRACCMACGGVVALNVDGRLVEVLGRKLMLDAVHADGAGLCIGVRP